MNEFLPKKHLNHLYEGWTFLSSLQKDFSGNNLNELLETLFDQLKTLEWLTILPKGAILLTTSDDQLVLCAHYGFPDERTTYCERVSLDRCACGEVMKTRTLELMDCDGEFVLGDQQQETKQQHYILPILNRKDILGVVTIFIPTGHQPNETELSMVQMLGDTISIIIGQMQADAILQVKQLELSESKKNTIHHLGKASEYRDNETGMHVLRMSHYASIIAKHLGVPAQDREMLTIAAPMHDVGKIGISDAILLKPGRLTTEEFDIMKKHTQIGWQILEGDDELMATARDIAISHHERWDGSGYPKGLKYEEISLNGRICCLADVFDALTSKRPYKKAWPIEKAVEVIKQEAGTIFDPTVVEAFMEVLPEILRIKSLFRDEIIDPHEEVFLPAMPVSDEEWIPWDNSYSVGIDTIDHHHQYLFKLTNTLHDSISKQLGSAQIAEALHALHQYTVVHFREEERMMQHYDYQRIDIHVSQHRYFNEKVSEFWQVFSKSPLSLGFEIIYYLRDWLVDHIQKEDKRLSEISYKA